MWPHRPLPELYQEYAPGNIDQAAQAALEMGGVVRAAVRLRAIWVAVRCAPSGHDGGTRVCADENAGLFTALFGFVLLASGLAGRCKAGCSSLRWAWPVSR